MHRLDEARLDRGNQRRMRIQRPMTADLAVEPQRLGVGRQQQLDRRGVEADAVVQALHAVFGVDALDRHHRHQHLDLGDLRRIAREQRLDVVRPRRLRSRSRPSRTARRRAARASTISLTCAMTMPLRKAVASTMAGVSSVLGPVYRLPVAVGRLRGDEAHVRRQVDEIAAEQLEIGMDRADLDACPRRPAAQDAPPADRRTRNRALRQCRARTRRCARAARAPTARGAGRAPSPESTPTRHRARKSACFWLLPSRQTRSPGSITASSSAMASAASTRLPWRSGAARASRAARLRALRSHWRRVDGCRVILSRRSRRSPSRPLPTSPSPS